MRLLATAFQAHATFSELTSRYQGFILDQFGVLHNGQEALPGAAELVEHLAKANKKLIILSNTSSPAHTTLARLPGLGFNPDHFIGAVTSGDEASRLIRETYGGGKGSDVTGCKGEPKKFIWFTWGVGNTNAPSPLHFLRQCGNVEPTLSVEDADFVVAHGSGVIRGPGLSDADGDISFESMGSFLEDGDLAEIDKVLKRCLSRNLPMICANPDFVVQYGDGGIRHMPGNIARRYQEMGGVCTTFGKPHSEHFEACIRELGLDKADVAHVGDSLHHDIAGANAAQIPSVFVASGIHNDELGAASGGMPDDNKLIDLFEKEGATPTHVVPMFRL
jgi:ribonucleotide monophosphatase NagD (HAD superfamily)